jgi:hypothetical protein
MPISLERAVEIMENAVEGRIGGLQNYPAPDSDGLYEGQLQIILENEGVTLGYWNSNKYSESQRMQSVKKARSLIKEATKIVKDKNL